MAAGILLAIVAAHALVETARDALFLRDLPAERLPYAYLAMAAGVLLSARIVEPLARRSRAAALRALLAMGAVGHLGFAALAARGEPAVAFALYVWAGVLATQLALQLWLLVARLLDVGRAKRDFARIGAGGLAGAVLGAGGSALLLLALPVGALLPVAAALLLAAALGSLWLPAEAGAPEAPRESDAPTPAALLRDPYAARVIAVAALLACVTIGVDYLFKAAVAEAVPRERLGAFFARYHTAVNAGALLVQLAITPRLLPRLGVTRSLFVSPLLVTIGAASLAFLGGLVPALATRGVQSVLDRSLHHSASEILFLPMSDRLRGELRGLAASLGQRGGQALSSLLLLAALGAGAPRSALAAGTALLAATLVGVVAGLRTRYVERFRGALVSLGRDVPLEVPELDLEALESLIAALSALDPDEVIAALDLLESYGKAHLVPPLVLYHPSPRVVVRALALFRDRRPPAVDALVPWLLRHAEAEVRAAALRARGNAAGASALRAALRHDPSPAVRAAAFAELSQRGLLGPGERPLFETLVTKTGGSLPDLARAVAALPAESALPWLEELAEEPDPGVAAALAEELARGPAGAHLPVLLRLLVHPVSREPARRALCALGGQALRALAAALASRATPRGVRLHLPRSISRFAAPEASRILTEALAREDDPRVRYKILRGLGRMRAEQPQLEIDAAPVLAHAESSLRRAIDLLALRVEVEREEGGGTEDLALLERLLSEMEDAALELVFRALHILEPEVGYRALFVAVRGSDPRAHAAAREVLQHVVGGALRDGLLAMVSPGPAPERLAAALAFHVAASAREAPPRAEDAGALVRASPWEAMASDADPILAALAARARPVGRGGHRVAA